MKRFAWMAGGAALAGAVYVAITKHRHPVIGGPGYPMHQTTWEEAFKIAFLGAKYPEPISIPAGSAIDLTTGKAVPFVVPGGQVPGMIT